MERIRTSTGRGLLAASLLLGLCGATARAETVTRLGDGLVDVKADHVPLKQLLEELSRVTPIPSLLIEPKLAGQSVSAYIEKASVPQAIRKALEESGVQFMLWGGGDEPLGLYVGDLSKAGLRSPRSSGNLTAADLASMSSEERLALRDEIQAQRAEIAAASAPPPPDPGAPPADTIESMAAKAAQGGGAGGNTGDLAMPGQRGTATWVGADGQSHQTGYTIQGETVIYDDPNFVSFKNSPEAKARRMNMDVSSLP